MFLRILIFAFAAFALLLALIVVNQRRLLYPVRHVNTDKYEASATQGILHREVDDISVEAWLLLPPRGAPTGLVVHGHGNGETIELIAHNLEHYTTDHNYAVLIPEFRGYGRSGGSPSLAAILGDFEYFLGETLKLYPQLKDKVVYHGRSLGGGIVGELAKRVSPQAIILESTFTSVADMGSERFLLPRSWIWDNYDTESFLKGFKKPVLIIHGRQDQVIPFIYAERNRDACSSAEFVAFEGTHNDTMSRNLGAYREAISKFLKKL